MMIWSFASASNNENAPNLTQCYQNGTQKSPKVPPLLTKSVLFAHPMLSQQTALWWNMIARHQFPGASRPSWRRFALCSPGTAATIRPELKIMN
jgi:hypothetical protein